MGLGREGAGGHVGDSYAAKASNGDVYAGRDGNLYRKSDGQWKIVALHLSTNTFNNVLLTELRQLAYTFAVGGVVAGLLAAGAWRLWRRRQHA